ncbi:MAG: sulfite exporter TauE/SafE family protein [Chloroflexota bacterium]|nr:sulfite exporter TauE/SafE family protein [Chloroflexota bacterium]
MLDAAFVARALAFGSLIGFSLGALGAGGSILTVPILVYAMGVPVQGATGTSLAIVGLNAAVGAVDYLRRGRALPKTGIAFGASGVLGAFAGVWLNHQLRGELILVLFSLLMLAAAFSMVRRSEAGAEATSFDERYQVGDWVRLVLVGLGVGFLTGFFGVGGGFLIVPALVVILGLPMHLAVGTSLLAIALNAVWGLLGNLRFGTLDWTLTFLFATGGVVGVLAGGKLAWRLPDRTLRVAFAILIVGVAVYTFSRSLSAILGT